jgi:hypothetical protein
MSDSNSSFGKFVPGFEFMQNLARQAAGGITQGVGQTLPQLPSLGSWVAPTFSVEDLEKRIEELKAVHFWLDQNTRALSATIQALEVQKMTLSTLQGMNFSLGDVANALKIKAADTLSSMSGRTGEAPAPAASTQFAGLEVPPPRPAASTASVPGPAPAATSAASSASADPAPAGAPAGGVIDPMQWWGALSQQFQAIATNAMKDASRQTALDASKNMATAITREAMKTATDMTAGVVRSVAAQSKAMAQAGAKVAPAKKAASKTPRKSTAAGATQSVVKAATQAVKKATGQAVRVGAGQVARAGAATARSAVQSKPASGTKAAVGAPRRGR